MRCTHYEYDAVKIKKFYGSIDEYLAPGEKVSNCPVDIFFAKGNPNFVTDKRSTVVLMSALRRVASKSRKAS